MDNVRKILPELIEWSQEHACRTCHHGLSHWNRVARFGQQLCDLAEEQLAVSNEQLAVSNEQLAVSNEQLAVSNELSAGSAEGQKSKDKEAGTEAGQINRRVVLLFAYLHDSCRLDDYADPQHGPRAARQIEELRDNMLGFLSEGEFGLLQRAIRVHTSAQSTDDITVNLCLDSDRLDLGRVGITPDPEQMASRVGSLMAASGEIHN